MSLLFMPALSAAEQLPNRPLLKAYLGDGEQAIVPLNAITQAQLRFLGYYSGKIDNDFGPNSQAALRRFQKDVDLIPNGVINRVTVRSLEKSTRRKVKRTTGKSLNGEWAKLGKCGKRSVEIRGNIIIKRHRGRLSVPRLDFFEFSDQDKLFLMIADERANFEVGSSGLLKTKAITSWLLNNKRVDNSLIPKPKPEELELAARIFQQCG